MKNLLLALVLALCSTAQATETGIADQVMRIPAAGGRGQYGQVDISKSAAVTGTLPLARGGTGLTSASTAGNHLNSDGTNWVSSATSYSGEMRNLGLASSVGASALTVTITQADGSTNCSASAPCFVSFRSATATTGASTQRTISGALAMVVSSGSTLGHVSAVADNIYVYLIDNAGTVEVAVSTKLFDEGTRISTTAEGGAGASDDRWTVYSTTARSNVAQRLIGRLAVTEATAGTWATAPSEVSLAPFMGQAVTSNATAGSYRVESVNFTCSTGVVNRQSGKWVTSVAHNTTGDCTMTIATGVFSATPVCTCSLDTNATYAGRGCEVGGNSATSLKVTMGNGTTPGDYTPMIICMGPR